MFPAQHLIQGGQMKQGRCELNIIAHTIRNSVESTRSLKQVITYPQRKALYFSLWPLSIKPQCSDPYRFIHTIEPVNLVNLQTTFKPALLRTCISKRHGKITGDLPFKYFIMFKNPVSSSRRQGALP